VQLDGRRQPGEPGADDRDVDLVVAATVTRARKRPWRTGQRRTGSGSGCGSDELASSESRILAQGAANSPNGGHVEQPTTAATGIEWTIDRNISGQSRTRLLGRLGCRPTCPNRQRRR
jgi:hypothetical protein